MLPGYPFNFHHWSLALCLLFAHLWCFVQSTTVLVNTKLDVFIGPTFLMPCFDTLRAFPVPCLPYPGFFPASQSGLLLCSGVRARFGHKLYSDRAEFEYDQLQIRVIEHLLTFNHHHLSSTLYIPSAFPLSGAFCFHFCVKWYVPCSLWHTLSSLLALSLLAQPLLVSLCFCSPGNVPISLFYAGCGFLYPGWSLWIVFCFCWTGMSLSLVFTLSISLTWFIFQVSLPSFVSRARKNRPLSPFLRPADLLPSRSNRSSALFPRV